MQRRIALLKLFSSRRAGSTKFVLMVGLHFVQLRERALAVESRFRILTISPKPMNSSKTLLALILTTALGFIAGPANAAITNITPSKDNSLYGYDLSPILIVDQYGRQPGSGTR